MNLNCKICGAPTEVLLNVRRCPVCEYGHKQGNIVKIGGVRFYYNKKFNEMYPFQIEKPENLYSYSNRWIFSKDDILQMLQCFKDKKDVEIAGILISFENNSCKMQCTDEPTLHWLFFEEDLVNIAKFFERFLK
jgi:hypothetical protein